MVETKTELVPVNAMRAELPPILAGRHTPAVEAQVRSFYISVAEIFERWVTRLLEAHPAGLPPGRHGLRPLPRHPLARRIDPALHGLGRGRAGVPRSDARRVQGPQDHQPPDRLAELLLQVLQGVASEFRLPITVPNPAHAQFIPRGLVGPAMRRRRSRRPGRQLMGLPSGDTVFDYRDRAIIKFFLYSGARIGTACRLRVKDFHQDGEEATVTLHEKGDNHRRIGLHFAAAEAIAAYIEKARSRRGRSFVPGSTRGAKS